MRIIVVRHGQAEPKNRWKAPDTDRPLTARGRRQAERLEKVLVGYRPNRVLSSPALRCVQTVTPFAEKKGLSLELSDQLVTDAGKAASDLCQELLLSEPAHSTVMLCTHREVMVELIPLLSKESGRKLVHRPPGAKGGAWILRFRSGKLQKMEYRLPAA